MDYNKEKYINKYVQFFPGDATAKYGYIRDVDDLGWTFEITKTNRQYSSDYVEGIYFRNHASNFSFRFMEEEK